VAAEIRTEKKEAAEGVALTTSRDLKKEAVADLRNIKKEPFDSSVFFRQSHWSQRRRQPDGWRERLPSAALRYWRNEPITAAEVVERAADLTPARDTPGGADWLRGMLGDGVAHFRWVALHYARIPVEELDRRGVELPDRVH
jgi:hypothetical protein